MGISTRLVPSVLQNAWFKAWQYFYSSIPFLGTAMLYMEQLTLKPSRNIRRRAKIFGSKIESEYIRRDSSSRTSTQSWKLRLALKEAGKRITEPTKSFTNIDPMILLVPLHRYVKRELEVFTNQWTSATFDPVQECRNSNNEFHCNPLLPKCSMNW